MRCLDWDSALENIRKLKAHPKECSSSAIFVFWFCCRYVYVALVVNVGCDISSWAFTKTSINSPMSYHNADASAYATLTPLQFLLTRGICWFPYASLLWHNSFNSHKGRFWKMLSCGCCQHRMSRELLGLHQKLILPAVHGQRKRSAPPSCTEYVQPKQ